MRRATWLAPLALVLAAGALPGSSAEAQQNPQPAYSSHGTLDDIDRMLARADTEQRALAGELEASKVQVEQTRARIVARGRAYYRLVHAGLLPAGGGFDAIVDYAAKVERARRALDRDVASEAALVRRGSEIEARLARLRIERAPLELQREAMSRARRALQETDERRAAFTRAFETSVNPGAVAIYGADFARSADGNGGFRSLKGRLPFPIAGRAEVHKVNRPDAAGPGIELWAPMGSPVRSVAAGRVAFADKYESYGLTVIVDHGERYYSIYASLGGADAKVGDNLPAGGRIGVVGLVDGTQPKLYFEMRHNTTTLDPGPWLGL